MQSGISPSLHSAAKLNKKDQTGCGPFGLLAVQIWFKFGSKGIITDGIGVFSLSWVFLFVGFFDISYPSLCPVTSIQIPISYGLGDEYGLDLLAAVEAGNGAGFSEKLP